MHVWFAIWFIVEMHQINSVFSVCICCEADRYVQLAEMVEISRIKFNFSALQFQCTAVKRWKWHFFNRLNDKSSFSERHKSIDRWIKWHLLWCIRIRFLNFHMIKATSIYTAQNNAQWVMTHSFKATPTAVCFFSVRCALRMFSCYNIVAVVQHVALFWHLTSRCNVTVSHSTKKKTWRKQNKVWSKSS